MGVGGGGSLTSNCSYRARTTPLGLSDDKHGLHIAGFLIVSDHIWHSDSGGAIGIDKQTFIFKIHVQYLKSFPCCFGIYAKNNAAKLVRMLADIKDMYYFTHKIIQINYDSNQNIGALLD